MSLRLIFNSLSISGAAMFAGVMFAIRVILGGYWRSLSPADFLEWFSRNNVFIMRAIPFVADIRGGRLCSDERARPRLPVGRDDFYPKSRFGRIMAQSLQPEHARLRKCARVWTHSLSWSSPSLAG
jgi:hypothetical protein